MEIFPIRDFGLISTLPSPGKQATINREIQIEKQKYFQIM